MIVKVSTTHKQRDPAPRPDPDGIEYDKVGRMKYHPDFHDLRGRRFSEEELCYLAKFYKFDGRRSISYALGRPERIVQNKFLELQHDGRLEHFKSLDYYC